MNRVFLIGNLTRDPEFNTTSSGVAVCRFSIGVTRRFSQGESDFFNIVTWRATAENCQKYLKKGSKVAIIGAIQTRTYEAQDGTKRNAVDIVADEVQFLNTRSQGEDGDVSQSYRKESPVNKLTPVENDEDLPF